MAAKDKRRTSRIELSLPVRVEGYARDGTPWHEMTKSDDASFGGVSFLLTRRVETGHCLLLAVPLPKYFRRYDETAASYHVYALVRTVGGVQPPFRVGVVFLGRKPPKGFEEDPTTRFLLPSDPLPGRKERRLHRRLDIFLNLRLRRTTGEQEQTVAENLSKGGARVMTSLAVSKGETIEVEEVGGDYRTQAEIRNVYIGADGIPRLNLRFVEQAPERLVSAG